MDNYCSNKSTYYEDRIAYIDESTVDEVIELLQLNPESVKEQLWDDLGRIIMSHQPSTSQTKATAGKAIQFAERLSSKLQKAYDELSKLSYKNLTELSEENVLREKLEMQSLPKPPKQRVKHSSGAGIRLAQHEGEEEPKLYPFDTELYDTLSGIGVIIDRVNQANTELEKEKKPHGSGKNSDDNTDETIISLCQLYKKYTNEAPRASQKDGQVYGLIIKLLGLILPKVEYKKYTTPTALEKAVNKLRKSQKYSHIWSDV